MNAITWGIKGDQYYYFYTTLCSCYHIIVSRNLLIGSAIAITNLRPESLDQVFNETIPYPELLLSILYYM